MSDRSAGPVTDPVQRAILDLAAGRGEVVLAGNKESFAYLRYLGGQWLRTDGDTMTGAAETYRIQEAEVLNAIFWRAREMRGLHGPDDGRLDWAGVLAWLRDSHI